MTQEEYKELPEVLQQCESVYRMINHELLPIYLGVRTKDPQPFVLYIPNQHKFAFEMTQSGLFFMYESFSKLIERTQGDVYGITGPALDGKYQKILKDECPNLNVAKLNPGSDEASEDYAKTLKDLIMGTDQTTSQETKPDAEEGSENVKATEDNMPPEMMEVMQNMQEQQALKEDLSNMVSNLSEEEQKEMQRKAIAQQEAAEAEAIDDFEKTLLGNIKSAPPVVYDEQYFLAAFDKGGIPLLREEMYKISESERKVMFEKVNKILLERENEVSKKEE